MKSLIIAAVAIIVVLGMVVNTALLLNVLAVGLFAVMAVADMHREILTTLRHSPRAVRKHGKRLEHRMNKQYFKLERKVFGTSR